MENSHVQQELSIIREMIEKTKRETAETGYLFIVPGIHWFIAVVALGMIELNGPEAILKPIGIIATISLIGTSVFIAIREGMKEKVNSYPKILFARLWIACGISCIMTSAVFPYLGVYPHHMSPVTLFLVLGIGFFGTGAIYESRLIQLSAIVWWIGSLLMAVETGPIRLIIWMGVIFFGYIFPGLVLNRQYRNRTAPHET